MEHEESLLRAGGLVDGCSVTLAIYGADLDPREVTGLLGVEPTHSHLRGERHNPKLKPFDRGAWLLKLQDKAPAEPEGLVRILLDKLPPNPAMWQQLRETYQAHLNFGLYLDIWNRGFILSPETTLRIASLGIAIEFDVYGPFTGREGEGFRL